MNTFGLGKGVNRLWLGIPYSGAIIDGWREIVKFTVSIMRAVGFNLER